MTTPDLTPRVRRLGEDVTAIADTVVEIKHTVDEHTRILAAHGTDLAAIRSTLDRHGEALTEILRRLDPR